MWLSSTLTWCIAVFLMTPLLTDCYPRSSTSTFLQRAPLASQKLLSSQYQAAIPQSPPKINDPVPQGRQKTVSVYCHEEAIEVVMNADLFASGFPVYAEELLLGSPSLPNKVSAASCGAVQTGKSQLTILAYFKDCGTKLHVSSQTIRRPFTDGYSAEKWSLLTGHKPAFWWSSVSFDPWKTSGQPTRQASKNRDTCKLLVNNSQTHVVFNLSSQVTGDSLVYSNVVVYSPLPSPDGVLRQEGAVIPVECHYRRYADKPHFLILDLF